MQYWTGGKLLKSPFFGVFSEYNLTFEVVDPSKGYSEDMDGNPAPIEPDSVTIKCFLKANSNPALRAFLGADETEVVVSGRLISPMAMPSGLFAGAECPLSISGKAGMFKLGPTWPGLIPSVTAALGEYIAGTWKAAG